MCMCVLEITPEALAPVPANSSLQLIVTARKFNASQKWTPWKVDILHRGKYIEFDKSLTASQGKYRKWKQITVCDEIWRFVDSSQTAQYWVSSCTAGRLFARFDATASHRMAVHVYSDVFAPLTTLAFSASLPGVPLFLSHLTHAQLDFCHVTGDTTDMGWFDCQC